MAMVDLDKLAKALRDESRVVTTLKRGGEIFWIACGGIVVYPSGRIEFQQQGVNPHDVTAVVRHMATISPVAPVPDAALRERIYTIIYERGIEIDWASTSSFAAGEEDRQKWSRETANAILAVLPPVDGVTVPRDLAMRVEARLERLAWWETECGEDHLADAATADVVHIRGAGEGGA